MQKRHRDRLQYFNEQRESTQRYVVPYILRHAGRLDEGCRVLEVGCGEGGNLYPFALRGCRCYGVDPVQAQINNAREFYGQCGAAADKVTFLCRDIYDTTPQQLGGSFDLVLLRDVIEHIPNQERFMGLLKDFLAPGGLAFFAFPPWRNPFGGHQQVAKSRVLSHLPYVHLLPKRLYKYIADKSGAGGLMDIRATGISIARFERILKAEGYRVLEKTAWLFNPNYRIKYGLPPVKLWKIFQIPHLQDFYTTAAYYVVEMVSG